MPNHLCPSTQQSCCHLTQRITVSPQTHIAQRVTNGHSPSHISTRGPMEQRNITLAYIATMEQLQSVACKHFLRKGLNSFCNAQHLLWQGWCFQQAWPTHKVAGSPKEWFFLTTSSKTTLSKYFVLYMLTACLDTSLCFLSAVRQKPLMVFYHSVLPASCQQVEQPLPQNLSALAPKSSILTQWHWSSHSCMCFTLLGSNNDLMLIPCRCCGKHRMATYLNSVSHTSKELNSKNAAIAKMPLLSKRWSKSCAHCLHGFNTPSSKGLANKLSACRVKPAACCHLWKSAAVILLAW